LAQRIDVEGSEVASTLERLKWRKKRLLEDAGSSPVEEDAGGGGAEAGGSMRAQERASGRVVFALGDSNRLSRRCLAVCRRGRIGEEESERRGKAK